MNIMARINGESMFQSEPQVTDKKNFSGKVYLYIGNLSQAAIEEEIRILLEKYGEIIKCELHLEKACAIVEMDCATDVKKVKHELHGIWYKSQQLEILDAHAIRMKKFRSWIPNEILEKAFDSSIGNIKYTIVFINKKNKYVSEGIIKFRTKKNVQLALNCSRKCYICIDPRPVNVESVEQNDANYMFGNKNLPRKTPKFCTAYKKRHFAHFAQSRIVYKYSKKWNRLEEKYERKNEELERKLTMEKEKLEDQLERELEKIFLSKHKHVIMLQKQMIMKALQNKE